MWQFHRGTEVWGYLRKNGTMLGDDSRLWVFGLGHKAIALCLTAIIILSLSFWSSPFLAVSLHQCSCYISCVLLNSATFYTLEILKNRLERRRELDERENGENKWKKASLSPQALGQGPRSFPSDRLISIVMNYSNHSALTLGPTNYNTHMCKCTFTAETHRGCTNNILKRRCINDVARVTGDVLEDTLLTSVTSDA